MTRRQALPFYSTALVISALYLSQGLPSGLIAHALPAFLREQGFSLAVIGALKLLALPWLLKFIWAPFIDRQGQNSQRFRWIFRMQFGMATCLILLSLVVSSNQLAAPALVIALLLMINLSAATQDIATDGFTTSQTPSHLLGYANSIQVGAYKIGMLLGGSGLLLLTPYFALPQLIQLLALVLLLLLVPLALFKRQLLVDDTSESNRTTQVEGSSIRFLLNSYKGFFARRSIHAWLWVLLTYKLADSLGSTLFKPMLVDQGIALSDIGMMTLIASITGLIGAFSAGFLYQHLGTKRALILFGVLQTLSVSSLYLVSVLTLSLSELYAFAMIEQFCDGLSTVALFALMMHHCRDQHEGSDYTIQSSLQMVIAGLIGALSGIIAQVGGYLSVYLLCLVLGAVSFLITLRFAKTLEHASS